MKKRICVLPMLCLVLMSPMTGPASADEYEPLSAVQPLASVSVDALVKFEPGSVPAAAAPLDAISPPIHALVLSMSEQGLPYDAQSDLFIWNALYCTLSLYGTLDDRVEESNGILLLPSESVQDYLSALAADPRELPDLPEILSDRVRYDQASDHYMLTPGRFEVSELQLGPLVCSKFGTYILSGLLLAPEENTVLCSFVVTLVQNDGMFGFSVQNLTIL